jgi:hypothetical protein
MNCLMAAGEHEIPIASARKARKPKPAGCVQIMVTMQRYAAASANAGIAGKKGATKRARHIVIRRSSEQAEHAHDVHQDGTKDGHGHDCAVSVRPPILINSSL